MRYPERLSPERLFFLSKEEREIYEKEWNRRPAEHVDVQQNDTISSAITEEYINEQVDSVYADLFNDIISETQYAEFKKLLDEEIERLNDENGMELYEGAEGLDHMAWLRGFNMKGIGKLFLAGLGMLGTGIMMLASHIRTKIAMIRLKKFMNRMVEVIDQGVKKKRSILSKLFNWKNRGEHNTACFRFVQEAADRNMALGVMQSAKRLGYFAPGQMQNIASGANPQDGGGLSEFNENILKKLNFIVPQTPNVSIPSK